MEARPGDIFLTRNSVAVGNDSPGHWNHCAMLAQNSWVVEAQAEVGVIAVPIWNFLERYPEILVMRSKYYQTHGLLLADYVVQLVGRKYLAKTSFGLRWRWGKAENCVSVVRRPFIYYIGDPRWIKPDDIVHPNAGLTPVAHKQAYEGFIDVEDRFKGMVQTAPNYPAVMK
jgi:uncharacterized protein YycO